MTIEEILDFRSSVNLITAEESLFSESMKEIQNPPHKYKDVYDQLLNMYKDFQDLSDLAKKPSGDLSVYKSDVNSEVEYFEFSSRIMETLVPELVN